MSYKGMEFNRLCNEESALKTEKIELGQEFESANAKRKEEIMERLNEIDAELYKISVGMNMIMGEE